MNGYFTGEWKPLFPEYKHSDTLAIVGMASTTRDKAPYEDLSRDLWGLNEALIYDWFRRKEPTMWFQLHPYWDYSRMYNRNDINHWAWLKQEHPFPIVMQAEYREIKNSVRYPIEDAILAFSQYFTSTPAYMLALGILMGYKRIEIFGIEMSADSEYIYQKAAFEYLIGFARGLGIEVYLPPECWLLRGNLYAYEDLRAASRTYFQFREAGLEAQARSERDKLWTEQGVNNGYSKLLSDPALPGGELVRQYIAEQMVKQEETINKAQQAYGSAAGALGEIKSLINWYDAQNCAADREELEVTNEQA